MYSDTYQLIIETFPWASITPTLHKVLAHSAQLIEEYNGGRGLKSLSEEGLEACHKHIRRYREQIYKISSFVLLLSQITSHSTKESELGGKLLESIQRAFRKIKNCLVAYS